MENNPYNKPKPVKLEKKVKVKTAVLPTEESEAIRAAVLSLGGDDDDFKMINEVDSDSEVEGELEIVKEKGKSKKSKDIVDVSNSSIL